MVQYGLKWGKCPKKCDEAPVKAVVYIERDRLVVVKCKRGGQGTLRTTELFISLASIPISGFLIWRKKKLHLLKVQRSTRLF